MQTAVTVETESGSEEPKRKGRAARWSVAVACLLAAALLYFALRGIHWAKLWEILRHAKARYLAFMLATASASYFLRAVRWRVLLSAERSVSVLSVFWATVAGYLGNSFLPARAGELIRSAMLGRSSGLGTSFVFATALSERLLDAATLVVVGVVTSSTLSVLSPEMRHALQVFGLVGVIGVVGLVIAPRLESWISRTLQRLPLPPRVIEKLSDALSRFLSGMRACQKRSQAIQFALLTVIAWLTDAFGASLVAQAIGLSLTIPQALFVLSALGLSSALPSTPGYLGVYQFVSVSVMPLFGYTQEQALAFILLAQVNGYVLLLLWALPMFLFGRGKNTGGRVEQTRI